MNERPGGILLVEDELDTAALTLFRLKSAGYDTMLALDGVAALKAIERRRPDLVLLDLNLPKMRGDAVCEKIKRDQRYKDIKVVFVSAFADSIAGHAKRSGADGHIAKPYEVEELLNIVRKHISPPENSSRLRSLLTPDPGSC